MPSLTIGDADSPIRIVVTPSQSAFFAGEPFSVKITFTNTRSQETVSARPSAHTHKRGSHSISSAPLARPPTSPGTPRSHLAAPSSAARQKGISDNAPRRKNLIGKPQPPPLSPSSERLPNLIEQRRKRQLAPKSLSVSVSPYDVQDSLGVLSSTSSFSDLRQVTLPHTSSPLARTDTLNLSSKHPHARKQSVLDGQISLDHISPTTSVPPAPYTPNSSVSSFTLALDPIAEGAQSPYLSTPALGSPTVDTVFLPTQQNTVVPSLLSGYPTRSRPTSLGLGQPPKSPYPRTATELILYSYAQLTGSLLLSQIPEVPPTNEQTRSLNSIRSALLNRAVLGGGSMDISSTLNSPNPATPRSPRPAHSHNRSSSLSAGLLSILSPTSLASPAFSPNPNSATSSKRRSTLGYGPSGTPTSAKFLSNSSSPSVFGIGFGNDDGVDIDPEEPLPTFETQPAMLAVDLSLGPGESRSYSYSIKLPNNLPPTFRGRSLRFSYELIIGTCRATNAVGGAVGSNSISRVMKVPIRVYNNVSVGNPPRPYDMLWPVSRRRDMGMPGTEAVVEEDINETHVNVLRVPQLPSLSSPVVSSSNTLESIKDYARSLLRSLPDEVPSFLDDRELSHSPRHAGDNDGSLGHRGRQNGPAKIPHQDRLEDVRWTDLEKQAEGGLAGCREAVEILTRNPKKASYDVNKDGVKVAVLTFPKSAYRLGETIIGVVELNERNSRACVLKVSAMLESHECLPSSISPPSSSKHLRRSHGEAHASFTLNTLRTTFALDIPSDASPAFQIRVGGTHNDDNHAATPGLSWKIRLCLLVGVASDQSISGLQGTRLRTLGRDGTRGEWGTSWIALSGSAPLEKRDIRIEREALLRQQISSPKSWSQFLVSSFMWRTGEGDEVGSEADTLESVRSNDNNSRSDVLETSRSSVEYDGIIPEPAGGVGTGVDYLGGEEGWRELKLETVECEVPIKVFPGNTAFRALDVVFDV